MPDQLLLQSSQANLFDAEENDKQSKGTGISEERITTEQGNKELQKIIKSMGGKNSLMRSSHQKTGARSPYKLSKREKNYWN